MTSKKVLMILIVLLCILSTSLTALAATGLGIEPVLLHLTVGDAASEISQTECDPDFAFKVDNSAENGTYPTGDGNIITITSSNGYTFDWQSKWPVTCVLVKAGKDFYNVFYYPNGSYGDTGLYAATNPSNEKPFEISHVTFGYNELSMCYQEETAWAKGTRYVERGNWAMYVDHRDKEKKVVDLIAGGGNPSSGTLVGTATISAPADGEVTIKISLTGGAVFYYDLDDPNNDDNLKVQDYATAPKGNPAPGKFDWKYSIAPHLTTYTFTVPYNNFYGIHLDVAVPVPCN
ncbi:MAG: hypothetical protein VB128_08575 [Sedimentibacter saalensis]|uniref:hypothetical protein n=1 Tax=Sedimentibacter saalensis TaxID=130788 RepID=UPI002B21D93A|nr:hypothetical protein [Sedimentibacter saalensis]MEA5094993.1 hypothetical protein [Sedimentibacter saalensis]